MKPIRDSPFSKPFDDYLVSGIYSLFFGIDQVEGFRMVGFKSVALRCNETSPLPQSIWNTSLTQLFPWPSLCIDRDDILVEPPGIQDAENPFSIPFDFPQTFFPNM